MGNNAQNLATSIKTVREIATAADFRFAFLRSDRSGLELLEAKLLRKNGACDAPTRRPSLPQPIARESVMHGGYQRPIPPPEEVVCPSFSADDFLAENGRGRGVRLQRATE